MSDRVARLRKERGWSTSTLSLQTARDGHKGVGLKTIEAIEANRGRVSKLWVIESIAHALDTDPRSFYEYPIALALADAASKRARAKDDLASKLREKAQLPREHPPGS